ncbi:hypothetical protein ACB098_05G190000 [Castanea mollissima]
MVSLGSLLLPQLLLLLAEKSPSTATTLMEWGPSEGECSTGSGDRVHVGVKGLERENGSKDLGRRLE